MYAGSSQKYTSAWPKNQNNVRARVTFTVGFQPIAHGNNNTNTSYATARVQVNQMIKFMSVPNTARGVFVSRFSFFHCTYILAQSNKGTHEPTINNAAPK